MVRQSGRADVGGGEGGVEARGRADADLDLRDLAGMHGDAGVGLDVDEGGVEVDVGILAVDVDILRVDGVLVRLRGKEGDSRGNGLQVDEAALVHVKHAVGGVGLARVVRLRLDAEVEQVNPSVLGSLLVVVLEIDAADDVLLPHVQAVTLLQPAVELRGIRPADVLVVRLARHRVEPQIHHLLRRLPHHLPADLVA